MKIIEKIEMVVWTLLISVIIYFLVPVFTSLILNTKTTSIICILFINTVYVFVSSLIYNKKYGFKWVYPVITSLLYVPFSLLLYKTSNVIYFIFYILVGMVSQLIYYKYVVKK